MWYGVSWPFKSSPTVVLNRSRPGETTTYSGRAFHRTKARGKTEYLQESSMDLSKGHCVIHFVPGRPALLGCIYSGRGIATRP